MGRSSSRRTAFRRWALGVIRSTPGHPLSIYVDPRTGTFRRGTHLSAQPVLHAGHTTSRWTGAPERFALEDAYFNQLSNQRGETGRKAAFIKPAVNIWGVPVEYQTAQNLEKQRRLPRGTVRKAMLHTGWASHSDLGTTFPQLGTSRGRPAPGAVATGRASRGRGRGGGVRGGGGTGRRGGGSIRRALVSPSDTVADAVISGSADFLLAATGWDPVRRERYAEFFRLSPEQAKAAQRVELDRLDAAAERRQADLAYRKQLAAKGYTPEQIREWERADQRHEVADGIPLDVGRLEFREKFRRDRRRPRTKAQPARPYPTIGPYQPIPAPGSAVPADPLAGIVVEQLPRSTPAPPPPPAPPPRRPFQQRPGAGLPPRPDSLARAGGPGRSAAPVGGAPAGPHAAHPSGIRAAGGRTGGIRDPGAAQRAALSTLRRLRPGASPIPDVTRRHGLGPMTHRQRIGLRAAGSLDSSTNLLRDLARRRSHEPSPATRPRAGASAAAAGSFSPSTSALGGFSRRPRTGALPEWQRIGLRAIGSLSPSMSVLQDLSRRPGTPAMSARQRAALGALGGPSPSVTLLRGAAARGRVAPRRR